MSSEIDNNIDWTVPTTPNGELVAPGLARPKQAVVVPATKLSILEKLLGANNLSATGPSGADPYNASGRQIRR